LRDQRACKRQLCCTRCGERLCEVQKKMHTLRCAS
jgi:hypothetical protein